MERQFVTVIMAGGLGKRMDSSLPKVLHEVCGRPLVYYVIQLAKRIGSERVILVIGYKRDLVIEVTKDAGVEWAIQEKQLGTGDAVKSARNSLLGYQGDVLVLSGDVPLLREESVLDAWEVHKSSRASVTVFTFMPGNPHGYGRIIRGGNGELLKIVEQEDVKGDEMEVREVNGGIYFFKAPDLFSALEKITNDNKAGEYYLTDTVAILGSEGRRLSAYMVKDPLEMAGVNDPEQLKELERYFIRARQV